jgi:hypothetical protein
MFVSNQLPGHQHAGHYTLLLLLLQIRTQPHLGCCLAAATAAASAIFMHLCTNSATPYTSRQHMRSCNDVNGNCANRRSRLTTAVAGHEKRRLGISFPVTNSLSCAGGLAGCSPSECCRRSAATLCHRYCHTAIHVGDCHRAAR